MKTNKFYEECPKPRCKPRRQLKPQIYASDLLHTSRYIKGLRPNHNISSLSSAIKLLLHYKAMATAVNALPVKYGSSDEYSSLGKVQRSCHTIAYLHLNL